MFVRATYYREKKTVHYFDENGEETLYIGGSFAWRTNNPGNMAKPGKRVVSTSIGYAQRTSNPKSLFLIFPDRATGDAERIRLLKEVYGDNSIASMIEAYAPRNENDTDGYIATVSKATGVDKSTRLDALTDDQFKKLTAAMAKHEGWIPGKIVPLGKPKTAELRDKLQQPLAGQPVALRGGKQEITVKTDAGGALPLLYPKLFEDKLSLYLDNVGDKIGDLLDTGTGYACTFIAPYFAMQSNAEVHETKARTAPLIHIVKGGETLGTIAAKYPGVTVDALVAANGLKDRDRIFARQHLRIPGKAAATAPAPKPASPPKPAAAPAKPAPKPQPKPRPSPAPAVQVDRQRTDKNHPITVLSSPQLEASGKQWCGRFLGNNTLAGLNADFRPKATRFIAALKTAGVGVKINAVFRPIERSYLMYWSFMICRGTDPTTVPPWPNVAIDWTHRGSDGKPDLAAAKQAAEDMCKGYGIKPHSKSQKVGRPKRSRHNFGGALDMNLSAYVGKSVTDADGKDVKVKGFSTLVDIGATYGVLYYPQENMHWSDTGH
jgi:LysM repeat protein